MAKGTIHPLFQQMKFYRLISSLADLPQDGKPQVLLAGKSNVGKSSLLNGLGRNKQLARTSQVAGKTRHLVFFDVAGLFYLVDMPGYGFSKSSKAEQERFSRLTDDYLHARQPISLILHIMDARHRPSRLDLTMIRWLEAVQAPYTILLNKADKLSRPQQGVRRQTIAQYLKKETGLSFTLQLVSAVSGLGLPELAELILDVLGLPA